MILKIIGLVTSMRNNRIGLYREKGKLIRVAGTEYDGVSQVPIYSKIEIPINFKYSNGEGLTEEEFNLFEGWKMQDGNAVIETNSDEKFCKGDKVIIDYAENMINKIIEKIDTKTRLRGNKINHRKIKILFVG